MPATGPIPPGSSPHTWTPGTRRKDLCASGPSGRDVLLLRDGRVSALYVLLAPAGEQG